MPRRPQGGPLPRRSPSSFHLPVVFLADNPGVMAGSAVRARGDPPRLGPHVRRPAPVSGPKIHVTLRKAFGFGSPVMGMNQFDGRTYMLALPASTLAAMPAGAGGRSPRSTTARPHGVGGVAAGRAVEDGERGRVRRRGAPGRAARRLAAIVGFVDHPDRRGRLGPSLGSATCHDGALGRRDAALARSPDARSGQPFELVRCDVLGCGDGSPTHSARPGELVAASARPRRPPAFVFADRTLTFDTARAAGRVRGRGLGRGRASARGRGWGSSPPTRRSGSSLPRRHIARRDRRGVQRMVDRRGDRATASSSPRRTCSSSTTAAPSELPASASGSRSW